MRFCVCALVFCAAACIASAENPFAGKWKLDTSKSQLTGQTFTIENVSGGMYRYSAFGQSYTFAPDGKEYPGIFGRTIVVKQIDPNTWERTATFKGRVLAQVTMKLSPDGKKMTETIKGTKPNGDPIDEVDTCERTGEGSGMVGTWKIRQVKDNTPDLLEFAENGPDGLAFKLPDYKATWSGTLDGKDCPATGPTVPEGLTLALKKTGDRSIDMVEKIKGKPVFKATYVVSEDGKTLTSKGSSVAVNEPTTEVYVRE